MATPQLVLDAFTHTLDARTRWDEPPALYTLTDTGTAITLDQIDLPDRIWHGSLPAAVPLLLADTGITRPHAYGVALRFEGYSPGATLDTTLGPAAHQANPRPEQPLPRTRIRDIPDRLEERALIAVLRTGDRFYVSNYRNLDDTARPGLRDHMRPGHDSRGPLFGGLIAFLG